MPKPLAGITVVEVANYVAGPATGMLLADLGADVIKVEPPGGEVMRGRQSVREDGTAPLNVLFEQENRGKRSIVIDLARPGGPELVHELLARADIFLTNMIAPRLRRFSLMPGDVHARNPRVIYVGVTGYGLDGPESDRLAFDYAAFWARSGIMSVIGHPGQPPVLSRIAQGDHTTGMTALAATLAALRIRDQTGEGQVVDVALQNTGVYTIATDFARALVSGEQPPRMDRAAPDNPLFNCYQTSDGEWIMLVHMTPDPYWAPFCAAVGHPEWATAPAYATVRARAEHAAELYRLIEPIFAARSFDSWSRTLDQHGLIWAPMADLPAVIHDPQLRHRGAFPTIEHPSGPFETVGVPFAIAGADLAPMRAAPAVGEHTQAILEEIGLDDARIAELAAAGILG
jgi:crotonobetainyl-CoA:carnitine CoA-transferase CaiB-like acyl-CoA transferase